MLNLNQRNYCYIKYSLNLLFQKFHNWALLQGVDGYITEGTGDNFFIIKDGIVISPEGRDILRGISRDYVMNVLCNELGMPIIEKNIDAYDVYNADEAFITGTPFCMLPVTSLNGLDIGDGKVGSQFSALIAQWSSNTGTDIIGQIKNWNTEDEKREHGKGPSPYKFK